MLSRQKQKQQSLPFLLTQFALNRKFEHQVFLSNSICSEQKIWTPSIPFWFRLRLACTLISMMTPVIIWEDVKVATYGPSWTLDPSLNWQSIHNNSWTTFNPQQASREKLWREKPKYVIHWLSWKESGWYDTNSP
jgi:hypothetical protein